MCQLLAYDILSAFRYNLETKHSFLINDFSVMEKCFILGEKKFSKQAIL